MSISYDGDVRSLEDAGKTDGEIAGLLNAVTVKPILIADLENFLMFEGLAKRNRITGDWEGLLVNLMESPPPGTEPLSAGLAVLFEHINKMRSVHVDTTKAPWAEDAYTLVGGLLQAGVITAGQWQEFYDLGGGRKFGDVVESDIATARQAYLDDQAAIAAEQAAATARAELRSKLTEHYNTNIAPVSDNPASVKADFIAGLRAAADAWEAEV